MANEMEKITLRIEFFICVIIYDCSSLNQIFLRIYCIFNSLKVLRR